MEKVPSVLATMVGVLVALAIGLVGLFAVFSDVAPGGTPAVRFLFLGLLYAGGSALVGALVPRRWYVAVVAAWGPVLWCSLGVVMKLTHGGPVPYWSYLIPTIIIVPALALGFGYLGGRMRQSRS